MSVFVLPKKGDRVRQVEKHCNGLMVIVILLTLFVGVYNLGDARITRDELTTLNTIKGRTPSEVIAYYHTNNQLLYSFMLAIVYRFSDNLYLLRWVSVSFGVLAVAMAYRWGKSLAGNTLALIVSFLLAITPIFDRYLREMRGYSATVFFGVLIFFSLWWGVTTNKKRYWISFITASILGIYTHFFVALALVTGTLIIAGERLFLRGHQKLQWAVVRSYVFSLLMVGMTLALLLIPIIRQLLTVPYTEGTHQSDFEPFTATWDFFQQFLSSFEVFSPLSKHKTLPDVFFAFVLLGCLYGVSNRERRRTTAWLALWWLLPFFTIPFMLAIVPWSIAQIRFYMFSLPAYLLLGLFGIVAFVEHFLALVQAIASSSQIAVDIRRPASYYLGMAILILAIAFPRTAQLLEDLGYLRNDQAWTPVIAYLRTEVIDDDIILCEAFGLPGGDDGKCRWHLSDVEELASPNFSIQHLGSISEFRRAESSLGVLHSEGRVWFVLYFREPPSYHIGVVEDVPGPTVRRFGNTWIILCDSHGRLVENLIGCGHWLMDHLQDPKYQFHYNLDLSQLHALSGDLEAANSHLEKAIHTQEMLNDPNGMKELRTTAAIVRFYAPASPYPRHSVDVNFDNHINLYGYSLVPDAVFGPSEVRVSFYWRVLVPLAEDYSVFVHLEDVEGNVVAYFDFQPYDGVFPISQWPAGANLREVRRFFIPGELPPGEYTFVVGLYRPDTMSRLGIVDDTGGESAARLGILTVDLK